MHRMFTTVAACVALVVPLVATSTVKAQTVINFENLPVGTAVTNQYAGVTFSIVGGGAANATIAATAPGAGQFNTTASPTRFIRGVINGGDLLATMQLTFTQLQRRVSFRTGAPLNVPLVVTVNAFDGAGTLIPALTQNINITAATSGTITIPVSIFSSTANIRSVGVYVNNIGSARPVIDDLSFCPLLDAEDPFVSITSPPDLSCVCLGSTVVFAGTLDAGLCGSYDIDLLQYRSSDAVAWTTIQGPFAGLPGGGNSYTGNLYSWTVPNSLPGGWYYFRSKMYTTAGRSESDVVMLYVDTVAPTISFDSPPTNSIVRSNVCISGLVNDQCSMNFSAGFRPAGSGAYTNVSLAGVSFPNLAVWPTGALPDGNYDFRLSASDGCDNTTNLVKLYTVDNTPPVALISNVARCSRVSGVLTIRGQVTDTHLAAWTLAYTGGDATDWVTIASGNSAIPFDGIIANWNTAGLRSCGYTLRLRATDTADNNCDSAQVDPNVTEFKVTVLAGCAADFNLNGSVSVPDIFDFLAAYFAGCP